MLGVPKLNVWLTKNIKFVKNKFVHVEYGTLYGWPYTCMNFSGHARQPK